jgi:hypothetical protein
MITPMQVQGEDNKKDHHNRTNARKAEKKR